MFMNLRKRTCACTFNEILNIGFVNNVCCCRRVAQGTEIKPKTTHGAKILPRTPQGAKIVKRLLPARTACSYKPYVHYFEKTHLCMCFYRNIEHRVCKIMLLAAGRWPRARKSSSGSPRTRKSTPGCYRTCEIKPRMQQNTKIEPRSPQNAKIEPRAPQNPKIRPRRPQNA